MNTMDTFGTDPAKFVDDFSNAVKQWRLEREQWEESIPTGAYYPWGTADNFKRKVLKDLDRFLDMQDQVNIMMLAALDDLRRD